MDNASSSSGQVSTPSGSSEKRSKKAKVKPSPQTASVTAEEIIEELKNDIQQPVAEVPNMVPLTSENNKSSAEGRPVKKRRIEAPSATNGVKDRENLLNIFPQKIWSTILDKVKDPSDLENLSNASTFFRNELLHRRTLFLFPKVWQILDIKYHQSEPPNVDFPVGCDSDYHVDGEGEIYKKCESCAKWNVFWWMPVTLSMRLVCQTWSTAIDSFLQEFPSSYKMTHDPEQLMYCTARGTQVEFDDDSFNNLGIAGLNSFEKHFGTTHSKESGRNPFLSRTVHLKLTEYNELNYPSFANLDELRASIMSLFLEFLSKYGHHIWYCRIFIRDEYDVDCYCGKFTRLLKMLPSLKVLVVELRANRCPKEPAYKISAVNPLFQFAENLQVLVASFSWIPLWTLNFLIRRNPQLTVLELRKNWESEDYAIEKYQLPNLRQLSIQIWSKNAFQNLVSSEVEWKLVKLSLDFEECEFIEWPIIFRGLEKKWAGTELTVLGLNLPYATKQVDKEGIRRDFSGVRLELPQIASLHLGMRNLASLDLILPMRNTLELLEVNITYLDGDENGIQKLALELLEVEFEQEIKFLGCSHRLKETNMWTLFPKLKQIELYEKIYNRKTQKSLERTEVFTRKEWKETLEIK